MKRLPRFQRPNKKLKKRVGSAWRKPRGIDSKQRMRLKSAGAVPRIGYGTSRIWKGLHPSGYREIIVYNVDGLKRLDRLTDAARIAACVGEKKRQDIEKAAREIGVKLLN
ncbi:50S ribosomal protein L32e [Candidatus Micrarchaeota archaeon]|nr:50S ribosomal protein L32e [Candidatus Micrarchaeota archaeon]